MTQRSKAFLQKVGETYLEQLDALIGAADHSGAGQFGLLYNSPVGTTPLSSDVAGDVMRLSEDASSSALPSPMQQSGST